MTSKHTRHSFTTNIYYSHFISVGILPVKVCFRKTWFNQNKNKNKILVQWYCLSHDNRISCVSYKTNTITHLCVLSHTSCCLKCASTQMKTASWCQDYESWHNWTQPSKHKSVIAIFPIWHIPMLILAEFLANGVPFESVLQKGAWICLWYRCTYYVLVSKSGRNLFKSLIAETCQPCTSYYALLPLINAKCVEQSGTIFSFNWKTMILIECNSGLTLRHGF